MMTLDPCTLRWSQLAHDGRLRSEQWPACQYNQLSVQRRQAAPAWVGATPALGCWRRSRPQAIMPTTSSPSGGSGKLTYDANSNLTCGSGNTYTWDARNQLTMITARRTTI